MRFPGLELITAPTEEPITLAEAKLHLRLDGDDQSEDDWVTVAIEAARRSLELDLEQQLVTATWDLHLDTFPGDRDVILLPRPPLQWVSSITYYDSDGTQQTLAVSKYQSDALSRPGRVSPEPEECWPATEVRRMNAVTIRFVAGYGAASAVPASLKLELRARVADYYADREKLRQALVATSWHGDI